MAFSDAQKTEITELKQFFEAYFSVIAKRSTLLQGLMGSGSNDIVIAGGAFAVMLRNYAVTDKPIWDTPDKEFEKLNDIDVFFLNAKDNGQYNWHQYFAEQQNNKLVTRKSNDKGYIKNPHVMDVYEENFVISPDDDKTVKVQYILTDYKTREELIGGFDFKHCTMNYHDKKLYVTEAAYDAAKNKKLIVNGDNKPAQWRIDKFKNSGYDITAVKLHQNEYTQFTQKIIKQTFAEIVREGMIGNPVNVL